MDNDNAHINAITLVELGDHSWVHCVSILPVIHTKLVGSVNIGDE